MSAKKWLGMFAAAVAAAVGLTVLFNILVDPFGVFGDPIFDWYSYDETNNPRAAKIAYLEKHAGDYNAYVIGSSSAASYSTEELNDYFGLRFYNLFVYGCDTKDYREFAEYLLENCEVRCLVLNLGINEAALYDEGEDDLNERMHARASGKSLLRYYLDYAFVNPKISFEKIVSRVRDTELPQVFDVFDVPSGTYDKRVRDIEPIGDPDVYSSLHGESFSGEGSGAELPYIEECAASVAYIRDLCRAHGVSLIVIASPVWAGQWEAYDEETLRVYKTALAREVDYWDFSLTPLSWDSRYFYDGTHFRNAVGTMVLAAMFDNNEVWRPERFGAIVTAGNVEAHLDRLFSSPPAPDPADYSTEVPVLMYHHFAPDASEDTVVTPAVFEAQMKAVSEAGFHAVTAEELVGYVYRGEPLPDKPVFITMDDGYLSNWETAYPILEKYGLSGTVFSIGATMGCTERYKDTDFPITPHIGWNEAREMLEAGVVDFQSHTYDMHMWAPYEPEGTAVRTSVLPLDGESEGDYIDALRGDLARYDALRRLELGEGFTALAYPGGFYSDLAEVTVHESGIPVTLSTHTDRRNVLVKGLPQTLYVLCRYNVTDRTTPEELIDYLNR